MARANFKLVTAIRNAAAGIERGNLYQWGHMGACNCGHLAQELTSYNKAEIHQHALRKYGDWTDQVKDYCSTSGMPMDEIISTMLNAGLSREDLIELERLKNPLVLNKLTLNRPLNHNVKADVVLYMNTWANMLEDELIRRVDISELKKVSKKIENIFS
jgi:hypothetical protein